MKRRTLTEDIVIEMMREEYQKRLQEALSEVDVFDDKGNVLISQGLKVRHKDTQFEYTIDDVVEDPATGKTMIKLKLPDQPRFEPPPEEEGLIADVPPQEDTGVLGEQDPAATPRREVPTLPDERQGDEENAYPPGAYVRTDEPSEEEIFMIDQEEFEKEYEVK
jgi:hypothetical protein|tara:strand:+ start:324 stop:815 length:492 start_codon:yes stop_codon:yes gene_type:complete